MRPLIDSHLDLAYNALCLNRDITLSIPDLRASEEGMDDMQARAHSTVSLPELQRAKARICFAVLLARANPQTPAWKRPDMDFRNQEIASAHARAQLEYYHILEKQGSMRKLETADAVRTHWKQCEQGPQPTGYILVMEGADGILDEEDVARWHQRGLRHASLVHYGRNAYAVGTGEDGPLTKRGPGILREMERLGMSLDLTHLSDTSFFEALDIFGGRVHASHNNCRSVVPGGRQYDDRQIRMIIERKGVIGVVMDNWMLAHEWKLGETPRSSVTLQNVADHIDHICQLAGNTAPVGIGSDLDGGYGYEQSPDDLDTIHDLHKLEEILQKRGYSGEDIDGICYGNWLRFLLETLPAGSSASSI